MTRQPTPANILDNILTTDTTRPATIRNDAIKVDGGTQMRAQLDAATVAEYADTMTASGWGAFPPIIAYYDGSDYWLADGFHRLAAWRSIADFSDALIPADVRSGTRRDAILHAAGANASHGLRRTNADKRRAVETLLRDEEWAKWSNGEIARRCAVSDVFVGKVRDDLSPNGLEIPPKRTVTRNGTTYTQNTANIGAVPQPIPTPTAKEYSAAVQGRERFTLSTDDLPADLVAAGWTVRSKDLGSYWVVNETNGMESAIVRNWDGFAELCASLQKRLPSHAQTMASAISNQQSPISNPAPLPAWAQEKPAPPVNAYDAFPVPDGRVAAARHLMALYGAVIDSEEQYGELTGRFSDTLGVKRDLTNMIAHLADLIAAIEHPEEVTPDA